MKSSTDIENFPQFPSNTIFFRKKICARIFDRIELILNIRALKIVVVCGGKMKNRRGE